MRLFKRVYQLEGKLDKPFLYESELLKRIEVLEAKLEKRKRHANQGSK